MRAGRALAFGVVLALAAALPLSAEIDALQERDTTAQDADCASVYIIVARGSYETPGQGSMGSVAAKVCGQISGCDATGIAYPANMDTSAIYIASESAGAQAMVDSAKAYHKQCKKTPIVLMGYSQGAQVVGDAVCGHSEYGWTSSDAISGTVADRIIAIIQFGDPTFVAGKSWDVGSASKSGVVQRPGVDACEPFADRIQSYCDAGDPYCAKGNDMDAHHGYMSEYGSVAASFVVAKYKDYVSSKSASADQQDQATSSATVAATSVAIAVVSKTAVAVPKQVTTVITQAAAATTAAQNNPAVVVVTEIVTQVRVITVMATAVPSPH